MCSIDRWCDLLGLIASSIGAIILAWIAFDPNPLLTHLNNNPGPGDSKDVNDGKVKNEITKICERQKKWSPRGFGFLLIGFVLQLLPEFVNPVLFWR